MFRQKPSDRYYQRNRSVQVTSVPKERFSEQTYFEPHHEHITNTSGWKLLGVVGIFLFIGASIFIYFSVHAHHDNLQVPYPSYLPGHGTIVLYNSHSVNDGNNNVFPNSTDCTFTNDTYIFSNPLTNGGGCPISDLAFDNFALEAQMRIVTGDCSYIFIVFNAYYDAVYSICQDGTYAANFYNTETPSQASTAIYQGLDQSNLIDIVKRGNTISLYINKQLINEHQISSPMVTNYKNGIIYLGAMELWKNSLHGYRQSDLEVDYKEVKVWTL